MNLHTILMDEKPQEGNDYILSHVICDDSCIDGKPYRARLLKLATWKGKLMGLFEASRGKFRAEILIKQQEK